MIHANKIILKNIHLFLKKKILILGNVHDELYLNKLKENATICVQQFNVWKNFKKCEYNTKFLLLPKKKQF